MGVLREVAEMAATSMALWGTLGNAHHQKQASGLRAFSGTLR